METWKDIPGYEGFYKIDDHGRIKSLYTGKLRAAVTCGRGYLAIELSKHGKKKRHYIHRLAAETFLPQAPDGKTQVNHKNCDKTDNRVDNLEWVSPFENTEHAYVNGKTDFRRKQRRDNRTGCAGVSIHEAGFQAEIWHNQKRIYLGLFKTIDAAIIARRQAERRLLGENALL